MLSKVFTKAIKPAFSQVLRNKQLTQTAYRFMATSDIAKLDKGKTKLVKALSREIKFEEENYRDDDSVQTFLTQNGFSLRDNLEENAVELTKKVGNVTVQVSFASRPPQFDQEPEEDEEGGNIQRNEEGQEEAEQYGDQNYADFVVYIIQSNGKALAFECTSFDSEINVNFVTLAEDVNAHKKEAKSERPAKYAADFSILDERLQTGFLEYLKGFGINEDVALFVEHYSQDKDQRQYMKWLKDINEFIEKPIA